MEAKRQEIGELTKWIRRLHSKSDAERAEARARVANAYWQSLVVQIKSKLQGSETHRVSASDLLQEVWVVFFDRECKATDSKSLHALLGTIVKSTVINSWRHHNCRKRASRLEVGLNTEDDSSSRSGLDDIVAQPRLPAERFNAGEQRCSLRTLKQFTDDSFSGEPLEQLIAGANPQDAAVAVEEFNLLLSLLEKKSDLETILKMSLKGHTTSEIAHVLGTTKRTVVRKLSLIRKRFEQHQGRNQK